MKNLLVLLLLFSATAAAADERPVTLKRDFGTLYGTLLTPDAGTQTAALIIAGSGPTDRNGNNPLGVNGNTYLLLAQELEKAGIASLRYDKRAIGTSRLDDMTQIPELTLDDYIGDAAALADLLSAEGFKKIVLIGHSEGALIALCAAQQSSSVSGVVSLAGMGYPMDEILRTQLAGQLTLTHTHINLLAEAESIIATLKRGETVDIERHSPAFRVLFNPGVQKFFTSCFRRDPRQEIRKVTVPVLIVNGDNDVQISVDNAEALAKAKPEAKKVILPGMTHLLTQSDARTLQEQVTTVYAGPSQPVDTTLTREVAGFIQSL